MFVPSAILQQCEELSQFLGTACLPYCLPKDGRNERRRAPSSFGDQVDPSQWNEIVLESDQKGAYVLSSVSDQLVVFSIPVPCADQNRWFVIGKMLCGMTPQLELLFRASTEAARRKQVLEDQEQIVIRTERDLHRSYVERQWSRRLNSNRSIRKRGGVQAKHAIESMRTLIDAESVCLYLYQDLGTAEHGLESAITNNSNWTIEDVRQILQKVTKPEIGDCLVLNKSESSLSYPNLRTLILVPLGIDSVVGYVVALNRRRHGLTLQDPTEPQFSFRDAEPMFELADYLLSEGFNQVHFHESEQLVLGVLRTMSNAIEARDPYTRGHSERVAHLAYKIAVQMQLSEVASQEIYLAGVLHDVGKIGIPDSVLLKPGRLDEEDINVIRQHPEIGHRILVELGKLSFTLPGVLYHHERIDGNGYPHRLQGEDIPLMARILAASDAYDAMTTSRVYRNAMGHDRAIEILSLGAGSQWDKDVVQACIEVVCKKQMMSPDENGQLHPLSQESDRRKISQALRVLQL